MTYPEPRSTQPNQSHCARWARPTDARIAGAGEGRHWDRIGRLGRGLESDRIAVPFTLTVMQLNTGRSMKRRVNPLLLIGITGVSISGALFGMDYGRAIGGNPRIWWTPQEFALPLEQTADHFQLLIDGEPFAEHLARNSLTALGPEGLAYFVRPEMVRVRLNNWPQTQASLFHFAVYSAFGLGASLACLILGLIEFFQRPPGRRQMNSDRAERSLFLQQANPLKPDRATRPSAWRRG